MYKKIVEYHYTGHEKQYLEDSIKFRCRFCGELKSASDFTEDAHAVAECVGNKKIFTRYECDCCNLKFAKAEEYQLGMLLRLYKAARHLKKKGGHTKIPGTTFTYNTEGGKFSIAATDKSPLDLVLIEHPQGMVSLDMAIKQKVNLKLVYRALVKFSLSVVPEDVSIELEDGYKKLVNSEDFPSYSGNMIMFHEMIENPCIAVYKLTSDANLPKYFCTVDVYQCRYIVPLDFGHCIERVPSELLGNLDIPAGKTFSICNYDYSDDKKILYQREQITGKLST